MNELGAGISIGVLAALVVFVIYFVGAKIGRWQPRNQSAGAGAQGGYPQTQGYGQNPYGQSGYNQSGRPWSSEDETRVLPSNAQGYDDVDADLPRATKNELAGNIQHSGQMIEANRRAATAANGDTVAVFTYILGAALIAVVAFVFFNNQIGRASCRERV